jgi:hypothetical protein
MTTSLRVGIVLSGQLVEERFFRAGTPITLGQSTKCDLSVPVEGLPREHVLFTADRTFVPPPGAEVVGDAKRGKLTVGDVTILFQHVVTPVAPRMALPAGLQQSLLERIDRRLALVVGASLVAHIAIAGYAWMNDIEQTPMGARYIPTNYTEQVIDLTQLVEPPTPTDIGPGAATTPANPSQTPRPIVRPTHVTPRTQEPVDSSRLAAILTGGESETGKGGMNGRQSGATLQQQINDAKDSGAEIGDGGRTSRVDDRAHASTDHGNITDDPTLTTSPRPTHDEPTGRVIPGPVKQDEKTTLTAAVVLDRINTLYMAGLQRCYRLGLATDSTLSGRVAISFTVDERGQVIDAEAAGVSSGVDGCIEKQMGNWRFPVPKDDDGARTEAGFTVSLALQPS